MKQALVAFFVFLSVGAFAQKANFKSTNALHPAGVHSQFNFTLTEFTNAAQVQALAAKMKASPGILKLDVVRVEAASAELIIITEQDKNVATVKKAFEAAGINAITYDGKKHKTSAITTVLSNKI